MTETSLEQDTGHDEPQSIGSDVIATSAMAQAHPVQRYGSKLVSLTEPEGARAEAIRSLRTFIAAQHVRAGRRSLAVCATSAGDGCSFVAANLAVALAQIGIKTLLIDGDLRDPGIDAFIRPLRRDGGLGQYLMSDDAVFADYIEDSGLPNLWVMYSLGAVANTQGLLAGERFKTLMDFCLRDFDLTIVDTPPANTSSDARRVSTVAGYSIIVARRDKTFIDDIKTLTRQLEGDHARVIGSVLNEA